MGVQKHLLGDVESKIKKAKKNIALEKLDFLENFDIRQYKMILLTSTNC